MRCSLLRYLNTTLAMAAALASVCIADDSLIPTEQTDEAEEKALPAEYTPISCSQFEELFPEAIKYPAQAYYTFKINGSSVVCFYDRNDNIALALVLVQAKRNAKKLAQLLHMQYNPHHTDREKVYQKAILFNPHILFQDCEPLTPENHYAAPNAELEYKSNLPFSTIGIMAGMYYKHVTKSNNFKFVNWNRQGIHFTLGEDAVASTSALILSPHQAQSPIVHKMGAAIHAQDIFPTVQSYTPRKDIPAKTLKQALKLSKLDSISQMDLESKVVFGHSGNVGVLGIPNRKHSLEKLPQGAPKAFPKQRSEWPDPIRISKTFAKEIQETTTTKEQPEDTKPTIPKTPLPAPVAAPKQPQQPATAVLAPQERTIHLPLTPQDALDTYLQHLQKLSH